MNRDLSELPDQVEVQTSLLMLISTFLSVQKKPEELLYFKPRFGSKLHVDPFKET